MNPSKKIKLVDYTLDGPIATIKMNDGGANLISPDMLSQINHALDKAEEAGAVVILTSAGNTFSAGFDLKILKTGVLNSFKMLIGGFEISRRLLSFPTPVVIGVNGHAIAMGAFLVLSGDYRIGVQGDVKISANEVAIGLTMPYSAIEICRQRLTPANFTRAVLLSEQYNPQTATDAGFLDQIVESDSLQEEAYKWAKHFASLDLDAHRQSKLRMRRGSLQYLSKAIRADKIDFMVQGFKRLISTRR